MNLARVAIAVADHLIPLTREQREDVWIRVLCLIDDSEKPIPYKLTEPHPASACDNVPEPLPTIEEPRQRMRPTPRRVSAIRQAATAETEAAARSIVEVLSGHPEGMSKGQLATSLNFELLNRRFVAALHHVVNAGRIRAEGNTHGRRYYPAKEGV